MPIGTDPVRFILGRFALAPLRDSGENYAENISRGGNCS